MKKIRTDGFAVITALTLMSFVLLLLLSLTTLIQVETKSAQTQKQRTLAQENALLALNLALGNLQRYAGPDQRVTANADISTEVADAIDAQALVKGGNRRWTAVWDSTSGDFLSYLISGYEDEADIQRARDFTANFTASGDLDDDDLAVLVGSGSANSNSGYVATPRKEIDKVSNSTKKGHYAWWVGDLGTRASLDVGIDDEADRPTNSKPALFAEQTAPGILFEELANNTLFSGLISASELPLILQSKGITNYADALKDSFYDITPYSHGLLTNVRDGGLKKSLNAVFEGNLSELVDYHGSDQIFGPQMSNGSDFGGPTWSQLKAYYELPDALSGSGFNSSLQTRAMEDDTGAILPVLLHFQYWIHGSLIDNSDGTYTTRLHLLPLIAFWNPYDATLKGTDYYLAWMKMAPQVKANVMYTDSTRASQSINATTATLLDFPIHLSLPDIPPGEIVVLTPNMNGAYDDTDVFLASGDRDRYLYIDGPTVTIPAGYTDLKMSLTNDAHNSNFSTIGVAYNESDLDQDYSTLDDLALVLQDVTIYGHAALSNSSPADLTFEPMAPYAASAALPDAETVFTGASGNIEGPIFGFLVTLRQPELVITDETKAWRQIRWLANYNPRASRIGREPQSYQDNGQQGFNTAPTYIGGTSNSANTYNTEFRSLNVGLSPEHPPSRTVLYNIPRSREEISSIGAFRHANLSMKGSGAVRQKYAHSYLAYDSFRPTYQIGESLADPRLLIEQTMRDDWPMAWHPKGSGDSEALVDSAVHYDWSYLLNQALFDRYYMSTASETWFNESWEDWTSGDRLPELPNTRLILNNPEGTDRSATDWEAALTDFDEAAANMLINGAFNVNSTSVMAWTIQLCAFLNVDIETDEDGNILSDGEHSPMVRSPYPLLGAFDSGNEYSDSAYAGFRRLDVEKIQELAEYIVEEVRARGPFMSLADFLNRSPDSSDLQESIVGALQAAIDNSDINEDLTGSLSVTSDEYLGAWTTYESFDDYSTEAMEGALLHGIPGFLTQGDLVERMGISLQARSDTFVIRAYGDSSDINNTEDPTVAVCEAIVQRTVIPVESQSGNAFEPIDAETGRRFKIVSFKWLSPENI
ncbi:hypothetical protein SH580_00125 [Coraliomargarita algicola]|uniref:Uncharacterized protein n=1 Tax=Coraliomargarita algicola TaxID=3092156 RepID=A0ABZ0RIS6_9BACT|nr:hypothetical protein [Coraliomargarita sp. J2-16]WPJ96104.1 hypothetical protein SH580_00125 [Coraliomargarita sp. J2-16]